jgi:hypothetical protein
VIGTTSINHINIQLAQINQQRAAPPVKLFKKVFLRFSKPFLFSFSYSDTPLASLAFIHYTATKPHNIHIYPLTEPAQPQRTKHTLNTNNKDIQILSLAGKSFISTFSLRTTYNFIIFYSTKPTTIKSNPS